MRQQFQALLDEEHGFFRPRCGEVRWAEVLGVSENEILVDVGGKWDGVIQHQDLERVDDSYRAGLQPGDTVPVSALGALGPQGNLVVSLSQGLAQRDWLHAKEMEESGEISEAEVVDVNRGGVVVTFGRLRGFVPNSQLTSVRRGMRGERLLQVKQGLVGRSLWLVVIEVDQRRRRLVLSQRRAERARRQDLLDELAEGDVRTGIVCSLVNFGVFVDLGGLDGLIHISELSWGHVKHPGEVLGEGDEIEVYVLRVDRERERVGLSRKRLLPDPWPLVTDGLRIGQEVPGTVTGMVEFGLFVDIGRGVEGLVHKSRLPSRSVDHAGLEPDSPVWVRVLEIDRQRRRIALDYAGPGEAAADAPVDVLRESSVTVNSGAGCSE
jgi:small subunit ribosomal protein S1